MTGEPAPRRVVTDRHRDRVGAEPGGQRAQLGRPGEQGVLGIAEDLYGHGPSSVGKVTTVLCLPVPSLRSVTCASSRPRLSTAESADYRPTPSELDNGSGVPPWAGGGSLREGAPCGRALPSGVRPAFRVRRA